MDYEVDENNKGEHQSNRVSAVLVVNAVNRMIAEDVKGVEFIAAQTQMFKH